MVKEDLTNSRFMDLHRTSSFVQVHDCAQNLLAKVYTRVPREPEERKTAIQHLTTLIMDLYAVHNIDQALPSG